MNTSTSTHGVARGRSAELLTTGQAAVLLGVSRQHVVDLCTAGYFTTITVGTHRRVPRDEVESCLAAGSMTRDQRRSLLLAHAVAGKILQDPDHAIALATETVARRRRTAHPSTAMQWYDAWEELLHGPLPDLLAALVSPAPRSRELRQNSPFAGLLPPEERLKALEAFARSEQAARGGQTSATCSAPRAGQPTTPTSSSLERRASDLAGHERPRRRRVLGRTAAAARPTVPVTPAAPPGSAPPRR